MCFCILKCMELCAQSDHLLNPNISLTQTLWGAVGLLLCPIQLGPYTRCRPIPYRDLPHQRGHSASAPQQRVGLCPHEPPFPLCSARGFCL